jgi:hypothetical protein
VCQVVQQQQQQHTPGGFPPDPPLSCRSPCHPHTQAWINTPRNKGGLGGCNYPLLSDLTKQIARDYEVLIEEGPDAGVALR